MYLRRIDMFGFKSFAKKMIFEFDEGITAIVGPNGSGKSNIADAIRWVLGEQSAKLLRGSRMQDVIFAGTESRKALGYCQVDLTIDNHDMKMPVDYSEVTVSRRVYRSGESEFYINGTACRLRDIHEFFLDTGVGKEGYSIIGQGQIDKILSTKPDDRRALFDEAAGIVKYKVRKKSAEKKLTDEEQNLLRVNDIIGELEERQDVLEEQAKTAKIYLSLKEDLKKNEVNIFIKETERLQDDIQRFVDKESVVNEQINGIKESVENIKNEHGTINQNTEKLEKKIEVHKDQSTQLAINKEKCENSIQLNKVEINNLKENNERINKQLTELEEKQSTNNANINSYQEDLDSLLVVAKDKESFIQKKKGLLEGVLNKIHSHEGEIDEIKTNIIERLNEISSVKGKIQRYQVMVENIDQRKNVIDSKKSIIDSTIAGINENVQKDTLKLDELLKKKNDLGIQKNNDAKDLEKYQKEYSDYAKSFEQKRENLSHLSSKLKALKDIASHYDGYNISIKRIMEYKKRQQADGIVGVVADIIHVNKDYEVAIEIALGASIQNVVTRDEVVAKRMIQYLKENRYGRATFLPLNTIRPRISSRRVNKSVKGVIGYANELVNTKAEFKPVIDSLLGNVLIVDHIDHGLIIAKQNNYSVRIVTVAGEVINPGGALTGGAYNNKGHQFLSRKRDIEEHQKKIDELSLSLNKIKVILKDLTDKKEQVEQDYKEVIEQENHLNLSINGVSIGLKQYENEIEKYHREISELDSELTALIKQKKELTGLSQTLESNLDNTSDLNKEAEDKVQIKSDEISRLKVEQNELSEVLTTIQIERSSLKQQIENKKENISRINDEAKVFVQSRDRYLEEINSNKEKIEEKNNQIHQSIEEQKQLGIDLVALEDVLKGLHSDKQGLVKRQEELYKKRDELSEQLNLLDKELLRIQNGKYKLETSRDVAKNHIWDEYELTYNNALVARDESLGSLTAMRKAVNELKTEIKGLGVVNVNSIEEYKAVSERYEFLVVQRDDIIEAREKLRDVIDDLNVRMEKQFKEKFKEIAQKFDEVFKELFGGGQGILRLTETDEVLESGIEIVAKPPGKKLQSMMLLSGGEKAFTAIALLFAIQTLKPSPFCVLDEIEAALDDANVVRFANYLKKLSKTTQFIIITHRRGTMEASDALYGITMQEKGVSTQVSVKLIEDDLED